MSERTELEEERQFLLDSLRDLEREHEAGEIGEADYESLRDDYTARAAEVLRALEAYDDEGPAGATRRNLAGTAARRAPPSPSRHSGSRKVVALALIAGFVLVAGASVFVLATGREPGESLTGSIPTTNAERLSLAHQLEGQGQAVEALKLYDAVLETDPTNVEALTYRGWLLKLAGLLDQSQASLDRAIALDPRYADVHFFKGMLLYQDRKDPAAAITEFEAFLALNPPAGTADAVRDVLERARRDLAAATSTTTTATP